MWQHDKGVLSASSACLAASLWISWCKDFWGEKGSSRSCGVCRVSLKGQAWQRNQKPASSAEASFRHQGNMKTVLSVCKLNALCLFASCWVFKPFLILISLACILRVEHLEASWSILKWVIFHDRHLRYYGCELGRSVLQRKCSLCASLCCLARASSRLAPSSWSKAFTTISMKQIGKDANRWGLVETTWMTDDTETNALVVRI